MSVSAFDHSLKGRVRSKGHVGMIIKVTHVHAKFGKHRSKQKSLIRSNNILVCSFSNSSLNFKNLNSLYFETTRILIALTFYGI